MDVVDVVGVVGVVGVRPCLMLVIGRVETACGSTGTKKVE